MFLCRTGRPSVSAAALEQVLKSPGSFPVRVKANRQRDVTLTLCKDHTFQRRRFFCVGSTLGHQRKQSSDPHPVQNWDSPGFVITGWGHLDRLTTIAANLSKRVQTQGGNLDTLRRPLVDAKRRRGEPLGNVLFTGNWGVSSVSRTMHTRASATATATKKSEEDTTDSNNKGDRQNLKEASTMTSYTEKAPGDPEPDGGKPNKTQQLKKVFKEYGAVGVSFHIGISLMSLGMFYLLISSGIDMTALLCKLGFSETVVHSKMAAGTSTFVVAYAIHKLFAPVRMSITLVSVPLIVRYFRKTGLFKPPTPAP
ncbi:protein FAM210B, mitochondrial [Mastacembelus armatus]|uniref:Family with sequence similarity 210 member B n=1 Tax=Mastacembelus armatus TaxID=205130 RepID=A0A7N8X864_9TELE|nr:protein FAM210B, mitochondrial [Mastacembelus armatus]